MKMINTNVFLLKTSFLSLCLVCFLPNLVKAQDVPSQQDLPKVNPEIQLLLGKPNQDIPLKLVDAVYLTLQNNRDVKIAYLQRIVDKARLSESESIFSPTLRPQLSLNLNAREPGDSGPTKTDIITNTTARIGAGINLKLPTGASLNLGWNGENVWKGQYSKDSSSYLPLTDPNILSQDVSFSISQPLLKDFGVYLSTLNIRRARLTESTNILNFRNSIAQTITNSVVTYRNLLLAQERLKIEEASFASAKEELDRLQLLFTEGKITKNDLIQRQADIAQKEFSLVNVKTNLTEAIASLTKLTDLPLKMLIAVEKPLPPDSLNLPTFEEMIKLAEDNNIRYLFAVNAVESAKLSLAEAKNQQSLDLTLNLRYGFNSFSHQRDSGNFTSSLVLSREFGNLSQDNAVLKSEVNLQQAEYSLANTRVDINEQLRNRVRNVRDSFTQIQLSKQATNLAELRLNSAREKMKSGNNVSTTDIINFEKGLVDAKNQELNVTISHLNSMTQLEEFLGMTLNKWLK
ncbi:TolC family protein [Cylindrospermopsis raciborskii CS-506_D]|uniref:TolC family protein n=2 Tax=Cylindrospermopsis raciborskii TaxID=77022 RepID=A0A838WYS0_9CYAN|nr:TolC family protein [Cylindrospermopsis raciborskii CS-506_C]MBA4451345.1 TolC family protein [Cylindrospermopsis raciborskii CS-506_D]MBA4457942.1 TolC family protein [Cylindrospermopsis raciborskii CS-506_B]MBA4467329.1 TolC family protein [Cylindrospermopsis raciborskii CS-506_A]